MGQTFTVDQPLEMAGGRFPTWKTTGAAVTLSVHREKPAGEVLARRRFENVPDNACLQVEFKPALPSGTYYLELSAPDGTVGWLGYDRVVNRTGVADRTTVIERQQGRGYQWGAPQNLPVRFARNEIELAVPRAALGLSRLPATLDFKWPGDSWKEHLQNPDANRGHEPAL